MDQLTDEQLDYVQDFYRSPAAELIFARLQAMFIGEWMTSDDPAAREGCWQKMQAFMQMQALLRDAKAMKQLDQRNVERRMYNS